MTSKARIFIGRELEELPEFNGYLIGQDDGKGDSYTWARFARMVPPKGAWDMAVFIGAEKLFRDRTKTSDNARKLRQAVSVCWMTLAAPPRRPIDWWNLLDILQPGEWGSFWKFATRYCNPHKRALYRGGPQIYDFSGADNVEELHARLSKICVGLPPLATEASDEADLRELGESLAGRNYPYEEEYMLEEADGEEG